MFWKKKKIYDLYIGGPMRHIPQLNKPMFTLVARILRERGYTVWSPAEHESYLELSFATCMTKDLNAVINNCQRIALLPGWKESLGANAETFSAFVCGKKAVEIVLDEDETDIELRSIDLSCYHLPYQNGITGQFNPHK